MPILVGIYLIWAFISGYKFVSGRSEWLDKPVMPNRICKIVVSWVFGCVFGAFLLVAAIIGLMWRSTR